ncbi:hypothetical protein [Halovivax gelatinilyticus]|uniref:hypothetical protein n=1 Tax=Halovivax gelatinilyticus TaxID=2961597 RepID=UPI0020CA3CCD|nr:hypothetical protein [Halovivax gelatinilyticus]
MKPDRLRELLEENGEVMVNVADFDAQIELHLHDTTIEDDLVTLELVDGTLEFATDEVIGAWKHYHSLDDYGLD